MNKIINININGEVFHVDEPAYERLRHYLDRLKNHFRNTEGREEILADIEARIAEMLNERIKGRKNVVLIEDVNNIIETMGQPEDMEGAETSGYENTDGEYRHYEHYRTGKRLFRNPEDKWIGGVCGGIGAYFGVNPLWIRLLFLIAVLFGFGTGLLIYIILWILIPEAITPSEKLEMYGEKVNISNIERTVRDNMGNFKKKVDGAGETFRDYSQHIGRDSKNAIERLALVFKEIIVILFKIALIITIVIGALVIAALFMGIFVSAGAISISLPYFWASIFPTSTPYILGIVGIALVLGIPCIALIYYGVRFLFDIHRGGRYAGIAFLVFWLSGLGFVLYLTGYAAKEFSAEYMGRVEEPITPGHGDTVYIATSDINMENTFFLNNIPLAMNTPKIKYNDLDISDIAFDIHRSSDTFISLTRNIRARGRTKAEAKRYAEDIKFNITQRDSLFIIDPAFTLGNTQWRAQHVDLVLEVPVNKVIVLLRGTEEIISDIDNVQNIYDKDMPGHKWLMTQEGLSCLDCTGEETKVESYDKAHISLSL